VVSGDDDAVFPAPDGAGLAAAIAGARMVAIPGSGYASMFEEPSTFVTSLEQFTG
jgi:pimeloyl-ACP methyl ester carboxylesterase